MPNFFLLGIDQESQRFCFGEFLKLGGKKKGAPTCAKDISGKKWPKFAIFLRKKVEIATFRPEVLTCHQYIVGFFKSTFLFGL
jgi:hypothetical protein